MQVSKLIWPQGFQAELLSVSILIDIFNIGQNGLALNKTKPPLILELRGHPFPYLPAAILA